MATSTSNTVVLTRAQRDAVLKYIEWGVESEVGSRLDVIETDCEEMRQMARWLIAAARVREMLWWEDPPAAHVDAFEIEVDDEIVWLAREVLGPHAQENMSDDDPRMYVERYPSLKPEEAEALDSLVAAQDQRDLDALTAAQLIAGTA